MHRSLCLVVCLLLGASPLLARPSARRLAPMNPPEAANSPDPYVRTGGGRFHDPFLLGTLKPVTIETFGGDEKFRWKSQLPYKRVQAMFQAARHSTKSAQRRAALEDLLWYPSEAVEDVFIDSLRDPSYSVREQAITGLKRIGTNRSIRPLIRVMHVTPGPLRDTIAQTLRSLTGESYGRHQDRWRRWYEANRDRLQ